MTGGARACTEGSKENMEPCAGAPEPGNGLAKLFREGADAIGTHRCKREPCTCTFALLMLGNALDLCLMQWE
jgi:hypothetical protein